MRGLIFFVINNENRSFVYFNPFNSSIIINGHSQGEVGGSFVFIKHTSFFENALNMMSMKMNETMVCVI